MALRNIMGEVSRWVTHHQLSRYINLLLNRMLDVTWTDDSRCDVVRSNVTKKIKK